MPSRSLRSPSTQKAFWPAPVRITARTVRSHWKASKQRRKSSPMAVFMALSASGRLSSTLTTNPSAERETVRALKSDDMLVHEPPDGVLVIAELGQHLGRVFAEQRRDPGHGRALAPPPPPQSPPPPPPPPPPP